MKQSLIIADIAGEMDALERLVALVPPETVKISVGDMVDRGSRSREVLDYFQDGYGVDKFAVMGNHCHMALFHHGRVGRQIRLYDWGVWHWNGGGDTLASYPEGKIPAETLDWMANLPLCMELENPTGGPKLFISHAPWLSSYEFSPTDLSETDVMDIVWNRYPPVYKPGYMQIFGHNSNWGLREFRTDDGTPYALCIDQSRTKRSLTGYLFPEGKVLEVPYQVGQSEDENMEAWDGFDT